MQKITQRFNERPSAKIYFGSLVCAIGAVFYCYEFILRIIPGALQTELSLAFGNLSASNFGQLSALYYFAYSPMQLPVGMLIDRFGPRRLLSFACLCCTLGSLMFMQTHSLSVAGLGRFLVGFGSAFAFVGVLSLSIQWLPQRFFSLIAGLMTTLGMLGLIYGEMQITALMETHGLDYVLMSVVIFGLILTSFIFLVVRDGPGRHGATSLHLNVFFSQVWQVLTAPEVWLIGGIGACLYTAMSVFGELWGKTYLEQAHHLTKLESAKSISALFLGFGLGAPLAGYFSDWTGRRVLPIVLGALGAFCCIMLLLTLPGLSYGQLSALLFLYGLFSASEIIIFIMAKERSGLALSGTVFAAVNMIVSLGGVIFQPLVGMILDWTHSYPIALSILPLSLALMFCLLGFLKKP